MFTVLMYGGIGDTLRNLSIFPHQRIYESLGIKTTALYMHWRLTGEHQYANPPGTEFFHAMADRFPSLKWGGETTTHRGPGAIANRLVREFIKRTHHGDPLFFPLHPVLSPEELAGLPDLSHKQVIAVQTHLLGTKTKAWGLPNWRLYLEKMVAAYPDARIVLIETAEEVRDLVISPNVLPTRHLNLYQLLHLFPRFNLTVSVDSWAKYAAAWNQRPQVIIVPDQRPQYSILTAAELIGLQFAGIFEKPLNQTIGLERQADGQGLLTLEHISHLSPEQLFKASAEHLQKFPASSLA